MAEERTFEEMVADCLHAATQTTCTHDLQDSCHHLISAMQTMLDTIADQQRRIAELEAWKREMMEEVGGEPIEVNRIHEPFMLKSHEVLTVTTTGWGHSITVNPEEQAAFTNRIRQQLDDAMPPVHDPNDPVKRYKV